MSRTKGHNKEILKLLKTPGKQNFTMKQHIFPSEGAQSRIQIQTRQKTNSNMNKSDD